MRGDPWKTQTRKELTGMSGNWWQTGMARRLFLTRLGWGAGVAGAAAVTGAPAAMAQATGEEMWHPEREAKDNWYDEIPGKHRFVFDTTTPEGVENGLHFASNYYKANREDYGLKDSDLAVLIITRHKSTTFGYNDAMWAKYGKWFSKQAEYADPKTKEPPKVNVFANGAKSPIGELLKMGAHFGVCAMSSLGISGMVAKATGGNPEEVFKEIAANLVGNARLVPAGILAVNRAQEHAYSYVYTG
jgi:hypothetical protein